MTDELNFDIDIDINELRTRPEPTVARRDRRGDLDGLREAMHFAWRPAGSMSLGDRWLRAGNPEEETSHPHRPLAPPKPPAIPRGLSRRRIRR